MTLAERVRGAVEHPREDPRRNRPGWAFACVERDQPLRAEPFERIGRERRVEQHVGEEVERLRKLPDVDTKLIDPLSPPTLVETVRAEQLQRVRERLAVRVVVPSLIIAAVSAATPRLSGRLELVRSAQEGDAERDERQIVLLRDDQLGAVRERRFVQVGTRSTGGLPGAGTSAIERLLRGSRQRQRHGQRERRQRAIARSRHLIDAPRRSRLVASPSCSRPASPPDRACPRHDAEHDAPSASDTCWRRA